MEIEKVLKVRETSSPLRQRIGLVLGPFLFCLALVLPAPSGMSPVAQQVLAVGLLMASWWITEALPLPVTSLLPFLLFPTLGISSPKAAARPYANDLIFLLAGGFFISQAMVRWNLHRRIALAVIHLIGFSPSRLVLGFMVATAFLSMWISNTASTLMLYPIGMAVLSGFRKAQQRTVSEVSSSVPIDSNPDFRFGPCLMLGIAYAASIGGVGTVIGTAPNAIMAGMVEKLYGQAISFTQWMRVGLSTIVVFLPLAWLWLTRLAFPLKGEQLPEAGETLREEREALGVMSREERLVLTVFVCTALAWVFREPKSLGFFRLPGINDFLPGVGDSTIAIAAVLVFFLLPVSLKEGRFLLTWQEAVGIPWGVLILLGGGLNLSGSCFLWIGAGHWMGGGNMEGRIARPVSPFLEPDAKPFSLQL